jgi:dolichol kinase
LSIKLDVYQASIIGKRVGRHRWSSTSSKTLEGSAAFVLSLVGCAWLLRLFGLTEEFSVSLSASGASQSNATLKPQTLRYSIVVTLSCALEALSDQNDNLTLPLYMWSLLVAVDV